MTHIRDPLMRHEGLSGGDGARLPALLLLLLVILAGSYFRLAGLGMQDFNVDELNHVFAARSLAEGEGPRLPSGNEYTRGMDITRLSGFFASMTDVPEVGHRLPSALFGILGIALIAAVAWKLAGPWAAVWAALLLAVYPEAVAQSRHTRFYTYQMLFGIAALFAGWRALEGAGARREPDRADLQRRWLWALGALVAFALAIRVQNTTFSVLVAWGVCVGVAAVADLVARGGGAWRRSLPVQLAGVGVAAAFLALAVAPSFVAGLVEQAQMVPGWRGQAPGQLRHYYWTLNADFPTLFSLFPAVLIVVAIRSVRLALYLGLWFGTPILIHSFLPWQHERYILLAMPAFFLAGGIAAAVAATAFRAAIRGALEQVGLRGERRTSRIAATGASAAVGASALFLIVTSPAFTEARKLPSTTEDLQWRTALSFVREIEDFDRTPIGSSKALATLYYWDRVDFQVAVEWLDTTEEGPVYREDGIPDMYTGVPHLTEADGIRQQFADAPGVIIGIDSYRLAIDWQITPSLRRALEAEATEICRGRCGNLSVYHWPFEERRTLADH